MNPADNAPPRLSFVCPIAWDRLSGEETAKYCDVCRRTVPNLSLMDTRERQALLESARTESVCAAFYTHLSGELVTPERPLLRPERVKVRQLGAAAAAAVSTLWFAAGCATPAIDAAAAGTGAPAAAPAQPEKDEDMVVLMAYGILCEPSKQPQPKGPASKRNG
ncbi:MAG: hypothetical protein ACREIA_09885 [Opitutaceae bacterium]